MCSRGEISYHIDSSLIMFIYFFFSFEFSQEEFVDLCILLGCDYVDKIKGIGPKKAIELVTF